MPPEKDRGKAIGNMHMRPCGLYTSQYTSTHPGGEVITQRRCCVSAEELQKEKEKYKVVNTELDATFAELTGF